jgi:hypothetical protein
MNEAETRAELIDPALSAAIRGAPLPFDRHPEVPERSEGLEGCTTPAVALRGSAP